MKERLAATDGGLVLRKDRGAALINAGLATKVPTVVGAAANRDVKAGGIAAACVDTLFLQQARRSASGDVKAEGPAVVMADGVLGGAGFGAGCSQQVPPGKSQ